MKNLMLPGSPRYQPKSLIPFWGYDLLYYPVGQIEMATLDTLGDMEVIPQGDIQLLTKKIRAQVLSISTTKVDEVERKVTQHDIRAWIQLAVSMLPLPLRRWVHIPLTSYDPLATGQILQFVTAHRQVIRPSVKQLAGSLIKMIRGNASVIQIGRTHGQHAIPITIGFWLATILNRIMTNAKNMDRFNDELVGKISGAVGCRNAQYALGIDSYAGIPFEERVLSKLGLKPAIISTQILPPEPLAYYLYSTMLMTATLAQFGRDSRHLMRSEIGEISEPFGKNQVGSSTMAHKRNPFKFEGLEGDHIKAKNEMGKVNDTLISEHQRDLVGSRPSRDFPIIPILLVTQLGDLLRMGKEDPRPFIERINIDKINLKRNFDQSRGIMMAEPIYISLQMAGYNGDAHEVINHKAMPLAQSEGITLLEAVMRLCRQYPKLNEACENIPLKTRVLLARPEKYIGNATENALMIANLAESYWN